MTFLLRVVLVAILGLTCLTPVTFAWGDDGHQIVARIAARKLVAKTRRRIVSILRSGVDDELHLPALLGPTGAPQPPAAAIEDAFAKMATWPDHMPGGKGATAPWHFIDVGLFEGPVTTANRCTAGCITGMIPTLIANISANKNLTVRESSGQTRTFRPDQEFRFLIHFLGDIHQPLHASTNADAGGNCIKTTGFPHATSELHAVWDTDLVRLVEKQTLQATASAILTEFQSQMVLGGVTDADQIAAESFTLAKNEVYPKTKPTAIPIIDHFVDVTPSECGSKAPAEIRAVTVDGPASFDNEATKKIVREQMFKAGVRLATILNVLLFQ
jgi:hypothetical protein